MFLAKKLFLYLITLGIFFTPLSLPAAKENQETKQNSSLTEINKILYQRAKQLGGEHYVLLKVTEKIVNVRSGPNTDFDVKFQIRNDNVLWFLNNRWADWIDVLVIYGQNDTKFRGGWIHSNTVVGYNKPFSLNDVIDSSKGVPTGFRGITWGATIKEITRTNINLIPIEDFSLTKGKKTYTRKDEDLQFDGITVKQIKYSFFENRFYSVILRFNSDDWWKMKRALERRYGKLSGFSPDKAIFRTMSRNFETLKIECIEMQFGDYKLCYLRYKYIPIYKKSV